MDEFQSTWAAEREHAHQERETRLAAAAIAAMFRVVRCGDPRQVTKPVACARLDGVALVDESDDSAGGLI